MFFVTLNLIVWLGFAICYFSVVPKSSVAMLGTQALIALGNSAAWWGGLLVLTILCRLLPGSWGRFASGVIAGTILFALTADYIVFSLYKFHINLPILGLFISPALFELVPFSWGMLLGVLGIIVAIIILETVFWLAAKRIRVSYWVAAAFGTVMLLCWGAFNLWHAFAAFDGRADVLFISDSLPLNHGLTANSALIELGYEPRSDNYLPDFGDSRLQYPLRPLAFAPPADQPNVILLVVDGLRFDFVTPEIMPFLHRLGEKSWRFHNHFSTGSCTRTGIFGLFYGINGNYWTPMLSTQTAPLMLDEFIRQGYEVKAFSSSTLLEPEFNRTVFINVPDLRTDSAGNTKVERDVQSLKEFYDYLASKPQPQKFFSFVLLDSFHGYQTAPDYPGRFPSPLKSVNYLALNNRDPQLQTDILNLMKNSAGYVDTLLEETFARLETAGILKNTVVIITADHGNEANETRRNSWGHNSSFNRWQTQVPMIVVYPGEPPRKFNYFTSHEDVAPTLMNRVLGCVSPAGDYSTGKELTCPDDRGFKIFVNYVDMAVVYDGKIFVLSKYGIPESYDFDGNVCRKPLPPAIWKEALLEMRRFSR